MTKLVQFTDHAALKGRLKKHGFGFDNPDRRYPTKHPFPSQVLSLAARSGLNQKALLLADRKGRDGPDRSRLLPWITTALGWSAWPKEAAAYDHHPNWYPVADNPAVEIPQTADSSLWEQTVLWLAQLDFTAPEWSLALLSGLLMTQVTGVFQRRAMFRATTARLETVQPDLFPETLPEPVSPTDELVPSWQWNVDAATRQGQVRDENQDALKVLTFSDDVAVLVVCDGAGGIGGGREASHSAVAAIEAELRYVWTDRASLVPSDLELAIASARRRAAENKLPGVTTALLVLLHGDMIHTATLGDGAVAVIWPDGMVGPVQVPHHTLGRPSNEIGAYIGGDCDAPPRLSSHRLQQGCFVLAMTDGASDLFTFEDFAATRHQYQVAPGLAGAVLAHLEAAKDPETGCWLHSDNMTMAIAHLCDGGDHDTAH